MDEYSRAHAQTDGRVKLVFLCSPGNPTGTALRRADMHQLIRDPRFQAIMVVDEAYVDFVDDDAVAGELATAGVGTMMPAVTAFGNVVVLQTLSKSFGLAGIR